MFLCPPGLSLTLFKVPYYIFPTPGQAIDPFQQLNLACRIKMTSSTSKQVYFGSATWLGADFTQRASKLWRDTNWEYLINICCELRQLQCRLVDKISIGHLSMERRILFEDGKSWLVRLRMPDLEGFSTAQGMKMALSVEVACLKFLRFVVLYFFLQFAFCPKGLVTRSLA